MEEVSQILRRRGYKKIAASASVSQALARLQSSHDAIFAFRKGQFVGLVNLYYSLLRHHPQPREKVERLLYHPPYLTPTDSFTRAAKLMAEARIYWLPVMEKNKLQGAVSAGDILHWLSHSRLARQPLMKIALSPAIYLDEQANSAQARQLMIAKKTTRLIINRRQKPVGVLSSYDLRQKQPELTGRKARLGSSGNGKETPIKLPYHRGLVTINHQVSIQQALRQLLASKVGSLAVLKEGRIIGLISYRNFLKYFSQPIFRPPWRFNFRLMLPKEEKSLLSHYLQRVFQRRPILREKIQRLDLVFSRQTQHLTKKTYRVTAQVWASGQKAFTLIVKGKQLRYLLGKIGRQLKKRIR